MLRGVRKPDVRKPDGKELGVRRGLEKKPGAGPPCGTDRAGSHPCARGGEPRRSHCGCRDHRNPENRDEVQSTDCLRRRNHAEVCRQSPGPAHCFGHASRGNCTLSPPRCQSQKQARHLCGESATAPAHRRAYRAVNKRPGAPQNAPACRMPSAQGHAARVPAAALRVLAWPDYRLILAPWSAVR